jgi:tetratricopeptide (TPR) repeat protein
VHLLSRKGQALERKGHFPEAEDVYLRTLGIDPLNGISLKGLARICLRRGEYKGGAEALEKFLAVHPSSDWLLYQLATAYRGLRRRDKAFKVLLRLSQDYPSHAQGLTRFGDACLERKDLDRAAEVFRCALDLEARNIYALRGLAAALRGRKKYREAIDAWQEVLKEKPRDRRALVRLGEVYAHEGRMRSARRAYSQALEINPADRYALDGMARLS